MRRDAYFPHTYSEVAALVGPSVAAQLDKEKFYGIAWTFRYDWKVLDRKRRSDGTYRNMHKRGEKPREEWLALPVPDSGIPREVAERARNNVELKTPA